MLQLNVLAVLSRMFDTLPLSADTAIRLGSPSYFRSLDLLLSNETDVRERYILLGKACQNALFFNSEESEE